MANVCIENDHQNIEIKQLQNNTHTTKAIQQYSNIRMVTVTSSGQTST